jgi:CheY-like chemotaxis protein
MKKILFIEDEAAIQKTFSDALSKEDYEITSAPVGEIGLRLAKEKKPDLILLDVILPEMDGFEVLKALREDAATKDISVIMLTNLEGVGDIEKAIEFGATTYLVKANYTLEEVLQKIKDSFK